MEGELEGRGGWGECDGRDGGRIREMNVAGRERVRRE